MDTAMGVKSERAAVALDGLAPYAASIFLSATLLFLVQPMTARLLLPRYGGAAGVWVACVMLFQLLLLLGYFYAHWSVHHLDQRQQSLLHVALLAAATWIAWRAPDFLVRANPARPFLGIIEAVGLSVGLPYFVLASTSPLLQSWCGTLENRPIPYRLYAVSNMGALLALVAYPFLIEPAWDLAAQSQGWRALYSLFAAFTAAIAIRAARAPRVQRRPSSPLPLAGKAFWVVLSACPAALLLAITNELCQSLAPVPLLWIAPLSIYLVTFVVAFDHGRLFPPAINRLLVPAALAALIFAYGDSGHNLWMAISCTLGGLFVLAMFCHGELAARKPEGPAASSFYLCIALGGALGAVFVGLLGPAWFSDYFELPVAVAVALVLVLRLLFQSVSSVSAAGCAAIVLAFTYLVSGLENSGGRLTFNGRNFYGTLSIRETGHLRSLIHGKTVHGSQWLAPGGSLSQIEPLSYYGPESGAGIALSRSSTPQRVGAIGLGTGSVAAYGRSGDYFRFYEINPLVERIARTQFGFLRYSPATVEVRISDARLALESESGQDFDTLVLDAFSGDSIPVHLLTREAFESYFRHLKPDGVLAVHVSNHYLDLAPLVTRQALAFDRQALYITSHGNPERAILPAWWVLVSRNHQWLTALATRGTGEFRRPTTSREWTDQYSNILSVIRRSRP
jgi:SAM-dependent methyltransferase